MSSGNSLWKRCRRAYGITAAPATPTTAVSSVPRLLLLATIPLILMLSRPAPARAQEADERPMMLTLDPGVCLVVQNRFVETGQYSQLALDYLGGTLEMNVRRPFAVSVLVGLGLCVGLVSLSGTFRYASNWQGSARVTAGAGLAIGFVIAATGDLALEIRSPPGFVFLLGPKLLVLLHDVRGPNSQCVDSCGSVAAGTYALLFRIGVGFNL